MRIETRPIGSGTSLILVAETEEESKLIDSVLGSTVEDDGLIAKVSGDVRLADGYGDHYIQLWKTPATSGKSLDDTWVEPE